MTSQVQFENKTDLPIVVASWRTKMTGLSEHIDMIIQPHTKETVYSDTDEWIVGSIFFQEIEDNLWKNQGLSQYSRMAKFRTNPCVFGNYTWTFTTKFTLTYDKDSCIFIWERILETN